MQLLEDHHKKMRKEEGITSGDEEEDDGAAWEDWGVDRDSDDSSDGWMDVSSDSNEHLEISDSGKTKAKGKRNGEDGETEDELDTAEVAAEPPAEAVTRISYLATTKV